MFFMLTEWMGGCLNQVMQWLDNVHLAGHRISKEISGAITDVKLAR
jgi:hypothetical protein